MGIVLPERRVTVYSGHIGDTSGLCLGRAKCRGRSVTRWNERLRFVARVLEGEKMAELCREFDISRKTGYKIFQRYKDLGLEGLTDRSRRPFRRPTSCRCRSKR